MKSLDAPQSTKIDIAVSSTCSSERVPERVRESAVFVHFSFSWFVTGSSIDGPGLLVFLPKENAFVPTEKLTLGVVFPPRPRQLTEGVAFVAGVLASDFPLVAGPVVVTVFPDLPLAFSAMFSRSFLR